jgi:hypothetical protein
MPSRLNQLPPAHPEDVLDYAFVFTGLGDGDNVATFVLTKPASVTSPASAASGQTVTVRLGPAAVGTHRIIVAVTSVNSQKATIEADWAVIDPE